MKMKMRSKQKGAFLISVGLGLGALIVIGMVIAHAMRQAGYEQKANLAYTRIETVHDAMQAAYMHAIQTGTTPDSLTAYPDSADSLIALGFISECTEDDEFDGLCINQIKLPWVDTSNNDQRIEILTSIDPTDNYPVFRLNVSIQGLQPVQLRNIVRAKLAQLPNFTDDGTGNLSFQFKRPGSSFAFENLVSRAGDTTMLDTWDYGAQYLDNVKDISFTGITDRSAITGMVKFGSEFIGNNAGKTVEKPSCPAGYQPAIEVWAVGAGGDNENNLAYNMRSFAAWYVDNGISWQLYFRVLGENSNGTPTFFYEGAVTYATWCEFI